MEAEHIARIFKALGHPTRVKIVEHLIRINTCVCGDLVDLFPFAQSTISQHLKQLKAAGIVCGEVEGPKTYFCVDKHVLKQFREYINSLNEKEIE